jgi:hypothetical protein
MYQLINKYQFRDAFTGDRKDTFSYEGLGALYDFLEEDGSSSDMGNELDVVAICCDFSEHTSATECAKDYAFEPSEDADEETIEKEALDFLQDNTMVIEFNGGVIIQNF